MPLTDIVSETPAEAEARLQEILAEEARTPFDLSRGPLVRAKLAELLEGA